MSPQPAAPVFSPLDMLGIVLFATSVFLPFFLTAFLPMNERTWVWVLVARVAWHGAGFAGLGWAVWGMVERSRLVGMVVLLPFACLFCVNPILDLVRGPLRVEGRVEKERTWEGVAIRSVHMSIQIRSDGGSEVTFEPSGLRANRWQAFRERCGGTGPRVRLAFLRHIQVPVEMTCLE